MSVSNDHYPANLKGPYIRQPFILPQAVQGPNVFIYPRAGTVPHRTSC